MESFKPLQNNISQKINVFESVDPFINKDNFNESEIIYNKFKNLIENKPLEFLLEIKYIIEKKLKEIN